MDKISLLILDDESLVLSSLKRLFHSAQYDVHTAQTPEEALALLKKNLIGVIICDQKLHNGEGTDFLAQVKKKWPDISRILLTGFFNSQIAQSSLLKGEVYRFITKPWNDDDMRITVENSWKRFMLLKQNRKLTKLIQSQNNQLKHIGLNLKNAIENRIEKMVGSQKAIEAKKIQLKITHSLIKGLNRSKNFKEINQIILKELKKLLQFEHANMAVQESQTQLEPRIVKGNKKYLSHLIFPLMDSQDPAVSLGILNLYSRKLNAFSQEDIKRLSDISNPIAIAIEKIKLLEIIEKGSKQWESTFDAISDLVTVIDKNFNLVKANRSTEKITHVKVENIIGKKCYDVLARRRTPCRNCPALETLKNKAVTSENEIIDFKDKDYLSWSAPILDPKHELSSIVVYYRDHTETSKLFRQLIQSEKMAAIGQLSSSLAHELNNPLTGITAFSQILLKDIGKKNPLYPDILEIEKASLRCKNIIENLLNFSEKSKPQKRALVSINDIINTTLPLIQYSASPTKQNILVTKDLALQLPKIKGSENELQQVFFNLLLNAIQAMPKGGKLKIKTQFVSSRKVLEISISDTGIGIAHPDLPKIFDPFYTTKEKTRGTGLGLFVSYGIVKDHKGNIHVNSQVNKGSIFKVTLPLE